jgi:hypothetical protein
LLPAWNGADRVLQARKDICVAPGSVATRISSSQLPGSVVVEHGVRAS